MRRIISATFISMDGIMQAPGGPTEDPHGVGVPNLMVFALGLNPGSPDRTQIPQPQLSSGSMVLNFMQPTDVSGLTYSAEWSTTLQAGDWHAATDTGSNPQHIFSVPIGANTRLFMRLKVMSP